MTELSRVELQVLLATTRSRGWQVVQKVLDKLVQDAINAAMDSASETAVKTWAARGARDLVAELNKFVAGLSADQISETASD